MSNASNSSSTIAADAVAIPLAGVSTIACIIALGVLLYYKMWRTFIYRLVFYMFISLIVSSLSTMIIYDPIDLLVESGKVNSTADGVKATYYIANLFTNSSLAIAFVLVTSLTVCIYLMAHHNYQFSYKSDLYLLISSIIYLMIVTALMINSVVKQPADGNENITIVSILCLPIPFNFVFTALTLVPLCCRACGYNLCMKTAATIESHRKALREILPLFILIVPSFLFIVLLMLSLLFMLSKNDDYKIKLTVCNVLLYHIPGLFCAVSFALHLCIIRKSLNKLRGKKRTTSYYGSLHRTHRTTAFTSEGISETCNTEYLPVSENEEDTRFLLRKSNQDH